MKIPPEIKKLNNSTEVIPPGHYCYSVVHGKIKKCPYWFIDENLARQENGGCYFLKKTDQDFSLGLLWDQCKECGINLDYEE